MEPAGGGMVCEGEWNALLLGGMYNEETDFMAKLLNMSYCSSSGDGDELSNMYSLSQAGTSSNHQLIPYPNSSSCDEYCYYYPNHDELDQFLTMKDQDDSMDEDPSGKNLQIVRNPKMAGSENIIHEDHKNNILLKNNKKRSLVFIDVQKRTSKSRKKNKMQGKDEERNSSCSDSEEVDGSQERVSLSSGAKGSAARSLNNKTRASRGSATDPQSLYARKRRERINERLRILQNLVPNGTKVDISTMLEEAVQYVKFLQLQIKLLSSDDMWMYAPLAYNGMDIGLDHLNISSTAHKS